MLLEWLWEEMRTELYWTELLEDRDVVGKMTLRFCRNRLIKMIIGHNVLKFLSCGMLWC